MNKKNAVENSSNINGTTFFVTCSKAYWIITLNPSKPMLLTDPDNWKYIILIKYISNGEKIMLVIVILCNILIFEKWAEENNLDEDILPAISPIEYSNDELAL